MSKIIWRGTPLTITISLRNLFIAPFVAAPYTHCISIPNVTRLGISTSSHFMLTDICQIFSGLTSQPSHWAPQKKKTETSSRISKQTSHLHHLHFLFILPQKSSLHNFNLSRIVARPPTFFLLLFHDESFSILKDDRPFTSSTAVTRDLHTCIYKSSFIFHYYRVLLDS